MIVYSPPLVGVVYFTGHWTILLCSTCRPDGPGPEGSKNPGGPRATRSFFPCLPAASVSLPASLWHAPDQPPPWRSLPAPPAPSSAAPPAPRGPTPRSPPPPPHRSGSPAAAAGLSRFASPPLQVWSTQMSFLSPHAIRITRVMFLAKDADLGGMNL